MRRSCPWTLLAGILASGLLFGPGGLTAWADGPAIVAMSLPDPLDSPVSSPDPLPSTEPSVASAPSPIVTQKTTEKMMVNAPRNHADDEGELELVTERFPNGSIRIEREVTLDAEDNYVSHGVYTSFDQNGSILRTGEFRKGRQVGLWTRYFKSGEGRLFSGNFDKQFRGPFVSEASFVDGEIHGSWIIRDKNQQKIIDWQFKKGTRHGRATWFYPNGLRRCEVIYKDGVPDGEYIEWDTSQKIVQKVKFIKGQSLTKKVEWYSPGRKRYEGFYMLAQPTTPPVFSWWTGTVTASPADEKAPKLKHGKWATWYRNGKPKVQGEYLEDAPVGRFTWWYENGQKKAEGDYIKGLRNGEWTTWHPSGMKESSGTYTKGVLSGKWRQWSTTGKLAEVHDFSAESPGRVDEEGQPEDPDIAPERIDEVKRRSPLIQNDRVFRLTS